MSDFLSDEQRSIFHRDGYVKLGVQLSGSALEDLQRRIDAIMLGEIRHEGISMQLDGGGDDYKLLDFDREFKGARLDYRKIEGLENDPIFRAYMQRPLFRSICDEAYGTHAAIGIFRAMFMNKPANKGTVLPWHQDGGDQWQLDRDPLVTVWTALDAATKANGCVQIIPGSHRLGLLSAYGHVLSDANIERHCRSECVVDLELAAGEVALLHNWLIHRSGINRTDRPRRAFSCCYLDARTVRDGKADLPIIFPSPVRNLPESVAV
jgi:phytanoyl-CoA hydroxylase